MLRKIHLHGKFAAYHDGPITIEADTPWDAIEAVTRQLEGFKPDPINGRQRIQAAGYNSVEDLKSANDNNEDIHIIPAITFGKKAGLIQTIIGATLIVIGLALGGTFWPAIFITAGITMMLGGLVQMLTPQPKLNTGDTQQQRSKYLPPVSNTTRIGTHIPLLYGERRVAGQILSINIDSRNMAA